MARENPETVVTRELRERLERAAAYTTKLSDSFTRGVPDLFVASDRVVMVEVKVDPGHAEAVRTYRQLGMSGAQDQSVREICRRAPSGACCVTVERDRSAARLWVPLRAHGQGVGYEDYRREADGWLEVVSWLTGAFRRT